MAIWLQYLEQPLEIIANLLSSFYDASTVLTWISDGSATVGFVKVSVILKMKGACCSLRAAAGCFPPTYLGILPPPLFQISFSWGPKARVKVLRETQLTVVVESVGILSSLCLPPQLPTPPSLLGTQLAFVMSVSHLIQSQAQMTVVPLRLKLSKFRGPDEQLHSAFFLD